MVLSHFKNLQSHIMIPSKGSCLLGHNTMLSSENQQTFQRNVLPPVSGLKNKPSKQRFLPASRWFLVWLILRLWRWRQHVPLKRRLTFNGLRGDISADRTLRSHRLRTANPTCPLYIRINNVFGHAIAQAVSRWLLTAAARVRAWAWSCGIFGGQSGTGAGFLRVLPSLLPIFIPPIAPQSPSSGAGTIGQ
jgi:hypothetical protein